MKRLLLPNEQCTLVLKILANFCRFCEEKSPFSLLLQSLESALRNRITEAKSYPHRHCLLFCFSVNLMEGTDNRYRKLSSKTQLTNT